MPKNPENAPARADMPFGAGFRAADNARSARNDPTEIFRQNTAIIAKNSQKTAQLLDKFIFPVLCCILFTLLVIVWQLHQML